MASSPLRAATLLLLLVLLLSPLLSSAQEATPAPAPAPTAGGEFVGNTMGASNGGRHGMSGWKTARAVLLAFVAVGVVALAVIAWRKRRARHAADLSSSRLELV